MGPKLKINGQINKLRRMQNFPKYYLYKYFDDLKRRVDLLHEQDINRFIEIITNVETFEKNAYIKWNSDQCITTYTNEINTIEEQFLCGKLNSAQIGELIQQVKI
jgi:hypothetical protein